MIHDVAITENYVVFNDLPMQFTPENLVNAEQGAFTFNKDMSAMYGVMKRDCKNTDEIKWFELPNHYVFHFANAWETTNDQGHEVIKMFGCSLTDVSLEHKIKDSPDGQEHPFLWEDENSDNRGKLTKFEFNMNTGEHTMKVIEDLTCDFPLIDMDVMGYESQFAYLTYFAKDIPEHQNGVYS